MDIEGRTVLLRVHLTLGNTE